MSAALTFESFDGREVVHLAHGDDCVVIDVQRHRGQVGAFVILTAAEALRMAEALREQATHAAEVGAVRVSGEDGQQ